MGSRPDPGAYSVRPELQAQVLGSTLTVQSKVLSQVLKNLLHRIKKLLSFHLGSRPDPGAYLSCPELQAQVLGHALAVQSKVLSHCLKNLLHRIKNSFHFIEARSPAPGHLKVKPLNYLRALIAAKSTRYSAMVLLSSINSFFMQLHLLFPGRGPKLWRVLY